jgi:serine/threonine protein kinase
MASALHCRNVVHRDLKLENLLLASPDEITKVHKALAQQRHGAWAAAAQHHSCVQVAQSCAVGAQWCVFGRCKLKSSHVLPG